MNPADDVGLDVGRYLRHLFRHWPIIVIGTLLGGGIGWAVGRMKAPAFIGTAQLTVMLAGSRTAADAVVTYQAALQAEDGLARAIARLQKEGVGGAMTPADLRSALSYRLGFPPNSFEVDVQWSDAMAASRIARVVAETALESSRQAHAARLVKTRELMRAQYEAADRAVEKARAELAKFQVEEEQELLSGELIYFSSDQHAEIQALPGEIAVARAELKSIETDLASAPSAAVRDELTTRAAASRGRIAGLEARRTFLDGLLAEQRRQYPRITKRRAMAQRRAELVTDLNRAQDQRELLDNEMVNDDVARLNALAVVEAPLQPGRPVSNRNYGPRGLAAGLILSVFGVLSYRGIWLS